MDVLYGSTEDFIFQEAVAFLKGKRALTSEEYKLLGDECRARAFTVSGYTSLEILKEFLACLEKAVEEGTTKEQFAYSFGKCCRSSMGGCRHNHAL